MRVHEKDTELKIPKWYLKLPQGIINCVSDICVSLSHFLNRNKTRENSDCNKVKFFL